MIIESINIENFKECIVAAFEGDEDILSVYDKSVSVNSIQDVIDSVFEKINSVSDIVQMRKVLIDEVVAGYIVFTEGSLISFGINKRYRTAIHLSEFWEAIKEQVGDNFDCVLFDYNTRAIEFLEKCGMKTIFKNVTTLQLCQ